MCRTCSLSELRAYCQRFTHLPIWAEDNRQYSALELAAAHGRVEVLRFLIEELSPKCSFPLKINSRRNFMFCVAVENGHFAVIQYLVEKAPNFCQEPVDITANDNFALRIAALHEFDIFIEYALETAPLFGQKLIDPSRISPDIYRKLKNRNPSLYHKLDQLFTQFSRI
jgi:ankyrin repeat protein